MSHNAAQKKSQDVIPVFLNIQKGIVLCFHSHTYIFLKHGIQSLVLGAAIKLWDFKWHFN